MKKQRKPKQTLSKLGWTALKLPENYPTFPASTKIPLIATNKLQSEKGFFAGTESERQQTLLNAAKNGFEYVDVDLSSPKHKETISQLKQLGAKPIVSYHKFDGALNVSAMENILDEEIASGAASARLLQPPNR